MCRPLHLYLLNPQVEEVPQYMVLSEYSGEYYHRPPSEALQVTFRPLGDGERDERRGEYGPPVSSLIR